MADDFNTSIDLSGFDLEGVGDLSFGVDPNSISSSVGRSVDNMQRNLYSLAWEAGNAVGDDDIKAWGLEGYSDNVAEMEEYGTPMRLKDAEGLADYATVFVNTAAAAAPQIAGIAGSGVTSTFITGTPVAGMAAYFGAQNLGEFSNRMMEFEGEGYEGLGIPEVAMAGAMTFVDTASAGLLAKPFTKQMLKQYIKDFGEEKGKEMLTKGLVKAGVSGHIVPKMVQGAIVEGSASIISESILEVGSSAVAGEDVDWDSYLERMKEVGILSAGMGGVMGGFGGYHNFHTKARLIDPKLQQADPIFRAVNNGLDWAGKKVEGTILKETWDVVTGDVVAPMRLRAKESPTYQKLINIFKGTEDVEQMKRDNQRIHQSDWVDTIDSAQKFYENQPKVKGDKRAWFDKLSDDMHGKVVNEATTAVRNRNKKLYADAVGRKMARAEDEIDWYIPSNMDKTKIKNEWDTFESELREQYKAKDKELNEENVAEYKSAIEKGDFSTFQDKRKQLSEEDLATSASRRAAVDSLIKAQDPDGMHRKDIGRVGSEMGNVEGHRIFPHAGQDFYNKWSKDGNKGAAMLDSMEAYGLRLGHRFASLDAFGKDASKVNRMLAQINDELVAGKKDKLSKGEIRRVYAIMDAYHGEHGRIQSKGWNQVRNVASVVSNYTTLSLATLGSFVELLNVAAKIDMSMMVRATATVSGMMGRNIMAKSSMIKPDPRTGSYKMQTQMSGMTWREANNTIAARLGDDVLSSRAQKMNTKLFKWNGLIAWTQAVRAVSAEAMRMKLADDLKILKDIPDSNLAKDALQRITEVGLSLDDVKFMHEPKSDSASIRKQNALYAKAINRFTRTVSMEPSFADRGLWMSDQRMWALSRLAGYPTMFTNTVLPMLGKRLRETPNEVIDGLFIIGAQAVLGVGQMAARDIVAGRDFSEREMNEAIMDSWSRNSWPRPMQLIYDAMRGERFGISAAQTSLGPVIGTASSLNRLGYRLTNGDIDPAEFIEETAYKLLPLGAFKGHWK